MPIVTLQMPIALSDGSIWLYTRPDTELPVEPQVGLFISGWNIPSINPNFPTASCVRQIKIDGVAIFAVIQGMTIGGMTADEVLTTVFGPGWILSQRLDNQQDAEPGHEDDECNKPG